MNVSIKHQYNLGKKYIYFIAYKIKEKKIQKNRNLFMKKLSHNRN